MDIKRILVNKYGAVDENIIYELINHVSKLHNLMKHELKINPDDYEFITETKLVKKETKQ